MEAQLMIILYLSSVQVVNCQSQLMIIFMGFVIFSLIFNQVFIILIKLVNVKD